MWTRLVVRARHVAGRGAPCRSAPAVRPASVPCGRALHLARSDAATQAARDAGVSAAVEQDHNTLQSILDVPKAGVGQRSGAPTGLFAIDTLRTPADFMLLAEKTLERTQVLVHRISVAGLQANAHEELVSVVRNLDRLSDMLCGVIDMAELVRHAHPEPAWAEAANSAYEYLCNFMNVLNTHTGLYDALRRVMSEPSVWTQLSEEAQAVALIFLRDFEKSGIQLPPHERERFVQLSDEIMVLGRAFLQDMAHGAQEQVTVFPPELLHGLDVTPITGGTTWRGAARPVLVAPGSYELHYISKNAPDARARKLAYEIAHTGRHAPVQVLEKLLRARHDLATLTGQPSFAHMALIDKMAGTPAHVQQFLSQAAAAARPPAEQMIAALGELKSAAEGTAEVQVWDREYYVQQYLAQHEPARLLPLSPYLSLGSVFTGLSRLFALLYGIHFRAATPRPGEVWADDVVKLEVVDETEGGVIGTIYCDLYSRAGKPPSAAHYTVRCSRRLDWDDVERDVDLGGGRPGMDLSPLLGVTGETRRGRPGRFQLPVVVLMTDFTAPGSARGASLLRWQDVETLFHEMGHAIHCTLVHSRSDDRTHRVPQRRGHAVRDRLCRAAIDPDGALCKRAQRGEAPGVPSPERRAAAVPPPGAASAGAAPARRTRGTPANSAGHARPVVSLGARG